MSANQSIEASGKAARSVRVVQSIIKDVGQAGDLYLMQYDPDATQYQPIGGKVEATDADSAAALRREITEELELDAPPMCALTLLSAEWATTKISPTYGVLTDYVFDFYHVTEIAFPITETDDTRWLSRAEIERGQADDSRPISAIYLEALGLDRLDSLAAAIKL